MSCHEIIKGTYELFRILLMRYMYKNTRAKFYKKYQERNGIELKPILLSPVLPTPAPYWNFMFDLFILNTLWMTTISPAEISHELEIHFLVLRVVFLCTLMSMYVQKNSKKNIRKRMAQNRNKICIYLSISTIIRK